MESVEILLAKLNLSKERVDIHISGDLLNQLISTNYASSKLGIPLIGIYSACATSVLSMIIGSNMISSKRIRFPYTLRQKQARSKRHPLSLPIRMARTPKFLVTA